jgi:hypothetical protein
VEGIKSIILKREAAGDLSNNGGSLLMLSEKSFYSCIMPILGFMRYFANRQKLRLKAPNLPAIALVQVRWAGSDFNV